MTETTTHFFYSLVRKRTTHEEESQKALRGTHGSIFSRAQTMEPKPDYPQTIFYKPRWTPSEIHDLEQFRFAVTKQSNRAGPVKK